jgi:hypothetical protein
MSCVKGMCSSLLICSPLLHAASNIDTYSCFHFKINLKNIFVCDQEKKTPFLRPIHYASGDITYISVFSSKKISLKGMAIKIMFVYLKELLKLYMKTLHNFFVPFLVFEIL